MRHHIARSSNLAVFRRMLASYLLLTSVALPLQAWAVDTDGDGVDDSIDAFPNTAEAAMDTDGDGWPDDFNVGFLAPLNDFSINAPWGNDSWVAPAVGTVRGSVTSPGLNIYKRSSIYIDVYIPAGSGTLSYQVRKVGSTNTDTKARLGETIAVYYSTLSYPNVSYTISVAGSHSFSWEVGAMCSSSCTKTGHELYGLTSNNIYVVTSGLYADVDDDNDGTEDTEDAFPLDKNEKIDTDGDRIGNNADLDDDNDGVADVTDKFPLDPTVSVDTDNDGIGNNADLDDDNDGVDDVTDELSLDPTESVDTDSDGIGNNADLDDDNDGVLDGSDNCPLNSNANQLNTDGDAKGNVCDSDDDNDGILDYIDADPLNAAIHNEITLPVNSTYKGGQLREEQSRQ